MPSRRRFLLGAGVGLAAVLGWRWSASSREDAILDILHKRLDYLTLDESGARQFARDFLQRQPNFGTKMLRPISMAGLLYRRTAFDPHGRLGSAIRLREDHVISRYLFSTDFFRNGADLKRVVRYDAYYDAMRSPCSNPWARHLGAESSGTS